MQSYGKKRISVLVSGSRGYKILGDPTEAAILIAGLKANVQKEIVDRRFQRIKELPFDSIENECPVVKSQRIYLFTKGAPDVVLSLCSQIEQNGMTRQLYTKDEKDILTANEDFGREALGIGLHIKESHW